MKRSFFARVHHRGDLCSERAAFGVGDAGDLRGPWGRRKWDERAEVVPDPGGVLLAVAF